MITIGLPAETRFLLHLENSWKRCGQSTLKNWIWEGIGFESDFPAVWMQPYLYGIYVLIALCIYVDTNKVLNLCVCVCCRRWKKESSFLKHSCEAEWENRPVGIEPGPAWYHKRHKTPRESSPKTHKKKKRKKKNNTKQTGGPLLFPAGNKHIKGQKVIGGGGRVQMFYGAIFSGTWPDPDPFYRTKLLEVCVCRTHVRSHLAKRWQTNPGAMRVLQYF